MVLRVTRALTWFKGFKGLRALRVLRDLRVLRVWVFKGLGFEGLRV